MGAIAFFGDKYGDVVRVLEAGPHRSSCAAAPTCGPPATSAPIKIVQRGLDRLEPAPHRGGHRHRPASRCCSATSATLAEAAAAARHHRRRPSSRASSSASSTRSRRCSDEIKALRAKAAARPGRRAGRRRRRRRGRGARRRPGARTTCASSPSPCASSPACGAVVLGRRAPTPAGWRSSPPSRPAAGSTAGDLHPGRGQGRRRRRRRQGRRRRRPAARTRPASTRRSRIARRPRPAAGTGVPACGCSALDLGSKRIGVAVSDRSRHDRLARSPCSTPAAIAARTTTAAIAALVRGGGGRAGGGRAAAVARRRGRAGGPRLPWPRPRSWLRVVGVPVETYDERLTTVTADRAPHGGGGCGPRPAAGSSTRWPPR